MPTKHLSILLGIVLLGLSAVFLIPHKTGLGPAGIALVLPDDLDGWQGSDAAVTKEELAGLAPDTGFKRRFYTNAQGFQMYVSIVLSGTDMANSIHRPERCLQAQGWTPEKTQRVLIPRPAPASPLEITRLTDAKDFQGKDGKPLAVRNLNYYWFIGSHDVTASHLRRTLIDVKDRILYGENQRWAYVTVSTNVTDNLVSGGRGLDARQTADFAEKFIAQLVPRFKTPATQS